MDLFVRSLTQVVVGVSVRLILRHHFLVLLVSYVCTYCTVYLNIHYIPYFVYIIGVVSTGWLIAPVVVVNSAAHALWRMAMTDNATLAQLSAVSYHPFTVVRPIVSSCFPSTELLRKFMVELV